jgi:hypothetical protein
MKRNAEGGLMVNCGGVRAILARARAPIVLFTLIVGGCWLLGRDFAGPRHPERTLHAVDTQATLGRLPIAFEPNRGQSDARVKFLAHGIGYGLYLTGGEAVLALPGARQNAASVVRMQLAGANAKAEIAGVEQLPGRSNYFIGNDPTRWHRNIPQFGRVRYRDVYPGVDLDFYGKQGRLEYDFEVYPGADLRQIELDLSGTVTVAANGDLVLSLDGREMRFQTPHVYQQSDTGVQPVAGKFLLRGTDRVGFEVGDYDRSRTLIIDPVLSFSTYLGGAGNESCTLITGMPATGFVPHCPSIAVDSAQRVYVAGATSDTTTFPAPAAGAGKIPPLGGASDVFVSRLNSTGTAIDFTSFIGGSGLDYPVGLAVDSGFNVYLSGTTNSPDFPTTPTALQATATGTHVFVSKLDPTGSANLYSTYLAGSGTDMASSLAVDSQGRMYVFGTTSSADFPVTPGALQGTAAATNQFFFSKVDPTKSGSNSLPYSTFIGGSSPSGGTVSGGAVAVDSAFNVYLAGGTNFTDMPVLNAFQGTEQGGSDVWVAKLNAPANNTQQYTPSFETYFGGSGDDIAYGIATDGTNTYVTGSTTSAGIAVPTGTSALQSTIGGGMDGFIAKFGVPTTTGTTQGTVPLSYFTYLGGSANDAGLDIVADAGTSGGNVRVTGFTDSTDFPAKNNPLQSSSGGGRDAFVARILTTTTTTTSTTTANTSTSTFLGGAGTDIGTSIAVDTALNTYVTGETSSNNFPIAAAPGSTALQTALAGTNDAFVSKLGPNVAHLSFICDPTVAVSGAGCPQPPQPIPSNPSVSPSPVGVGNSITFTYSIFNQGDPVTGAVFTDTVQGTNSTIASATPTGGGGTCTVTGGVSALCNLGTINTSNTTTTTSGSTTTSTTASAATVTVTVTATVPPSTGVIPPKPPDVGNVGTLTLTGTAFTPQTASGSASVNDFGVTAQPSAAGTDTVTAGATASYAVMVTPTGPFPEAVSLSATGQPAQAVPTFSPASLPNLNNGARGVTLEISTTARVTTPASLFHRGGPMYAFWLPLSGLALIGSGISRKRKWLLAMTFAVLLSGVVLQSACGSSAHNTSSTTGTPAGTYNITVNATSGSATRSTVVQLVVK